MSDTTVEEPPYYAMQEEAQRLHENLERTKCEKVLLQEELDQMSRENAHLHEELEQATREKVQAAEYGLAVLDEKQCLQQLYADLETKYDKAKLDLDHLQGVSGLNLLSMCLTGPRGLGHIVASIFGVLVISFLCDLVCDRWRL